MAALGSNRHLSIAICPLLLQLGNRDHGTIPVTHTALPPAEGLVEHVAHLKVFMKHKGFFLTFFPEDEKNWGLSFYGRLLTALMSSSKGLALGPPPTSLTGLPFAEPFLMPPHSVLQLTSQILLQSFLQYSRNLSKVWA